MEEERDREALVWQTGVWDRISDVYVREIDRRFGPVVDGVVARAALRSDQRVLDLGTGTGAVAERAAALVGPSGRVLGVDISPEMLARARRRVTTRGLTNVAFREGRAEALPVEDAAYDAVLASLSLMYVIDRAAAAREIARVLRPGGRSMITWFLLNDESKRSLEQQADTRSDPASNAYNAAFSHDMGHYRLSSLSVPEGVVGFEEEWARGEYEAAGLEVKEPIHYGDWTRDRTDTLINQDIVIAHKR